MSDGGSAPEVDSNMVPQQDPVTAPITGKRYNLKL